MKLYLIKTSSLRCYVLSDSTDRAIKQFERWLEDNNYGFSMSRRVLETTLVAEIGAKPRGDTCCSGSGYEIDMLLMCDDAEREKK